MMKIMPQKNGANKGRLKKVKNAQQKRENSN